MENRKRNPTELVRTKNDFGRNAFSLYGRVHAVLCAPAGWLLKEVRRYKDGIKPNSAR